MGSGLPRILNFWKMKLEENRRGQRKVIPGKEIGQNVSAKSLSFIREDMEMAKKKETERKNSLSLSRASSSFIINTPAGNVIHGQIDNSLINISLLRPRSKEHLFAKHKHIYRPRFNLIQLENEIETLLGVCFLWKCIGFLFRLLISLAWRSNLLSSRWQAPQKIFCWESEEELRSKTTMKILKARKPIARRERFTRYILVKLTKSGQL